MWKRYGFVVGLNIYPRIFNILTERSQYLNILDLTLINFLKVKRSFTTGKQLVTGSSTNPQIVSPII